MTIENTKKTFTGFKYHKENKPATHYYKDERYSTDLEIDKYGKDLRHGNKRIKYEPPEN